jgi:zinc transport system ATP-binding protein
VSGASMIMKKNLNDNGNELVTASLITAREVWVRHPASEGAKIILENISLTLKEGKITTLIGPNGAGKTTLLKVLLDLLPPTSGTIERKADLKVGYMPQKLVINPAFPLSVEGLLQISILRYQKNVRSLIDHCLAEAGAELLTKRRLSTLSGGETQRVMLARALVKQPDLLVLDEPMQGVDVLGQKELYKLIARIRDTRGCAILLVSHDLHLVMAASDEVICLNKHIS